MKGFTLLEVMLSLAVAATVILTALTSLNHHVALIEEERDKTALIILARMQMTILGQIPLEDNCEGTFAPSRPEITWRANLAPPADSAFGKQTLKVRRNDNKREVTIVRYIVN